MNQYNRVGRRDIVNGVDTTNKSSHVEVSSDKIRSMLARLNKSFEGKSNTDPGWRSYYEKRTELEAMLKRAERREQRSGHFYRNNQMETKRGDKLFTMADFPGKSPDDFMWEVAHTGTDENKKYWRDDLLQKEIDPDETIAEYIERMNEPVIKRKRFLAMMLSRKASGGNAVSVSRSFKKPMSAKRAAYYDEDL